VYGVGYVAAAGAVLPLASFEPPLLVSTVSTFQVVLTTIPAVGYLDERPVFPLERATTDAWAIGGREAEQQARKDFEAAEKEKQASQTSNFRSWQAAIREKRAQVSCGR
jgi:hypothetical protein